MSGKESELVKQFVSYLKRTSKSTLAAKHQSRFDMEPRPSAEADKDQLSGCSSGCAVSEADGNKTQGTAHIHGSITI